MKITLGDTVVWDADNPGETVNDALTNPEMEKSAVIIPASAVTASEMTLKFESPDYAIFNEIMLKPLSR